VNVGNHLHLLARARRRADFQSFLRDLGGSLAIAVTGARKGNRIGRFWDKLAWSRVVAIPPEFGGLVFGDSLLMRFLVYLTFGSIPEGTDVLIHPVGLAGWLGLFVTALNLFPVGQLDGGRIAYALFGSHHRKVYRATFAALLVLGVVTRSVNWFVWAALLFFLIGFDHTPPLDDLTPLSVGRRVVGGFCLFLLVLLIPPIPIQVQ